jgi:hypothetical protein
MFGALKHAECLRETGELASYAAVTRRSSDYGRPIRQALNGYFLIGQMAASGLVKPVESGRGRPQRDVRHITYKVKSLTIGHWRLFHVRVDFPES